MAPIKSQRGSSSLIILPLSAAIAVVASSFLMWFTAHEKLQAKTRVIEDSQNLSTSLKMMFSSRSACQQNLTSNAFGSNLSSLTPEASPAILNPTANGTTTTLFSPGQYYEGLVITSMKFSSPRPIANGLESSYISELNVSFNNPMTNSERSITMPFYFVTDSLGNLTDCLMTSYIPTPSNALAGTTPSTIEDLLCTQSAVESGDNRNYVYLPQNKTCIVNPQSNSPIVQD